MKYAWIQDRRHRYATALLCRVLNVSRSGYYDWRKRAPSHQYRQRQTIARLARQYHERSHQVYGYRKVHQDLRQEEQLACCSETVRKAMRAEGIRSRVRRKFVRTTHSNHSLAVAENTLNRDFTAAAVNQKWSADITYLRTQQGWLYLATILDLFSRRIVGWAMSAGIDAALVCDALRMALQQRCPGKNLLHHSDRGVQYAADAFQALLDLHGIECSMSRKGNCWDNAGQESFFGKLKGEWIQDRIFSTREETRQDVFYYIEVFYNRQRRHAALGYVSPVEFEARHHKDNVA